LVDITASQSVLAVNLYKIIARYDLFCQKDFKMNCDG